MNPEQTAKQIMNDITRLKYKRSDIGGETPRSFTRKNQLLSQIRILESRKDQALSDFKDELEFLENHLFIQNTDKGINTDSLHRKSFRITSLKNAIKILEGDRK